VAEVDSQARRAQVTPFHGPSRALTPARLLSVGGSLILATGAACLMLMVGPGDQGPMAMSQPEPPPLATPSVPLAELRPAARIVIAMNAPVASTAASLQAAPAPLPVDLVAVVTRDATADLGRIWSAVVAQCPSDNTGAGGQSDGRTPEFVLTFDADGEEIARTSAGDRGAGPGLSACFLSSQELRLRVPPPGRTVQATVTAPVL
jgi:hypothetical protein